MKKIILILFTLINLLLIGNEKEIKNSLVKLYTSHQGYNYILPWQSGENYTSTATGFIVEGGKIVTNAHAVLNTKYLQIRKDGEIKKYTAKVKFISEEYDLAIIEPDDKLFFVGTKELKMGTLPEIQENVTVYGYPLGGDKLSTTKGIVSRMEHNTYSLTPHNYLVGQTDAAINSGNSGGPVISKGKVVGVAFAGLTFADNIGYFIPVNILRHFINDIKDGIYDGSPKMGLHLLKLENSAHRKMLGLKDNFKGMLVKKVLKNSPFENVFQKNDVLLKLDGKTIGYDGSIEFRTNEKTNLLYIFQSKNYGDTLSYEILRDKKVIRGEITFEKKEIKEHVVKFISFNTPPSYYVYGGLVFQPITDKYLMSTSNQIVSDILMLYHYDDYDEVVILTKVLPYDINLGYTEMSNLIVMKVNNEKYKDFKDFVNKIMMTEGNFVVFELENGDEIVMDKNEVELTEKDLMRNYNIQQKTLEEIK